jgi:hypothetical protein
MKLLATLTAAAIAASLGSAAFAATDSQVQVSIGARLQDRAQELGQRDLDGLVTDLQRTVERELQRSGADVARADLVITSAQPNRPTMQQMTNRPGLSFSSFGLGGATIEGTLTTADGRTAPVRYRYYESDIRQARHTGTWGDAQRAFSLFAHRVSHRQDVSSGR